MSNGTGGGYQLGSDEHELARLDLQGRALAPATRAILAAAGIRPGMRVLDLGCGAGDMAFVAAGLVGRDGSVIGVDRSPQAVARARFRAGDQTAGRREGNSPPAQPPNRLPRVYALQRIIVAAASAAVAFAVAAAIDVLAVAPILAAAGAWMILTGTLGAARASAQVRRAPPHARPPAHR